MIKTNNKATIECSDVVVGRFPYLPISVAQELLGEENWQGALRDLLHSRPDVLAAIYLASRSLYDALELWLKGERIKNESAPLKALMYVLRMAVRSSPFGQFASIGVVKKGSTTTLTAQPESRYTATRPDMGWLYEWVAAIERDDALRSTMQVKVNPLVLSRGSRVWVINPEVIRRVGHAREYAKVPLFKTDGLQFIFNDARGLTHQELFSAMSSRFGAESERVSQFIANLRSAGVLLPALKPTPIGDPVGETLDQLAKLSPPHAKILRDICIKMEHLDGKPIRARTAADYSEIANKMSGVYQSSGTPIQVDMGHTFDGHVGTEIIDSLHILADAALRCGDRDRSLDIVKERFAKAYEGTDRLVPLLEFIDSDFGVGMPEDATAISGKGAASDSLRLCLAVDAVRDRAHEVVLSDSQFNTLLPPVSASEMPDTFEIGFQIEAADLAAVQRGDFLLAPAILRGSSGAGRSVGRFLHLFDDGIRDRIKQLVQASSPDTVRAELVYAPPEARTLNMCLRPHLLDYEVHVGTAAASNGATVLSAQDLFVGLENDALFLWSQTLRRKVALHENHLVVLGKPPALLRFLTAVWRQGRRFPSAFKWGPLWDQPMLPRLRYKNVIVSPAAWNIDIDLLRSAADSRQFLLEFADRWLMPEHVLFVQGDTMLPVKIRAPLASDLIFSAAFHGQKYARFIEFTPGFSSGWLCAYDGTCYNNEFVASFTSTAPVTQARDASYSPAYVAHIDSPITKTPNSEWTYAQVPCAPSEVDYLLEHLRPLVQDLKERDLVQRWFFLRYNSPNNHLRIRFQSAGATQQRVVRDIVCVALDEAVSELGLSGFSLQTYRPETERYGGLESLRLCERLFEHNSELFLSSLESIGASHNARFSIAMERAIELIASLLTRGHYKQWLLGNAHYEAKLSPEDRRILKLLQPKALGGALAVDGFLSEMGAALQRLESTGQLSRSLIDIVSAVLHMHCNRFGLGGGERRVRLIANALFRGVMTRG